MLRQISIQYGRCQSNQRLAGARLVVGFGPVRRYEAVLSRSLQAQKFPAQQRSRPFLLRLSCPDSPVPAGQQRTGCPPVLCLRNSPEKSLEIILSYNLLTPGGHICKILIQADSQV